MLRLQIIPNDVWDSTIASNVTHPISECKYGIQFFGLAIFDSKSQQLQFGDFGLGNYRFRIGNC